MATNWWETGSTLVDEGTPVLSEAPVAPDQQEDNWWEAQSTPVREADPVKDYKVSSDLVNSFSQARDENYRRYEELAKIPERTPEVVAEMVKSFEAGKQAEIGVYREQDTLGKLQTQIAEQEQQRKIEEARRAREQAAAQAPKIEPPKPEKSTFGVLDTVSALGEAAADLYTGIPASYYRLKEGLVRPDKYSPEAKAAFTAERQRQEYVTAEQAKREAEGTSTTVGEAIRQAGPSLGFTAATMGVAIPAGAAAGAVAGAAFPPSELATIPVGAVASMIAAGAASAPAAYRMAGNQFLDDAFSEIEKKKGSPLTEEEAQKAYDTLLPIAQDTGLWEAGPEAVGNAVTFGVGKFVFGFGKDVATNIAAKALTKSGTKATTALAQDAAVKVLTQLGKPVTTEAVNTVAEAALKEAGKTTLRKAGEKTAAVLGDLGVELGGETITQVGQGFGQAQAAKYAETGSVEGAVNEYEGLAGLQKAFSEVAPATLATMGIMGGVAGGVKVATKLTPSNQAKAERKLIDLVALSTKEAADSSSSIAPETARTVAAQADAQILQSSIADQVETADQKVARLKQEAKAAAGITLEEAPTPEAAKSRITEREGKAATPVESPTGTRIEAAAYQAPDGTVYYGASHLDAMAKARDAGKIDQAAIDAKQEVASRETPEFGFATDKEPFIGRSQAEVVATGSGQMLVDKPATGLLHSNEVSLDAFQEAAKPTQPVTPTAETTTKPEAKPTEQPQPITATRTVADSIRDKDTFIYNGQRGAISVEDGVTVFRPFGTQEKFEVPVNPNQKIGEIEGIEWARKGQVRTTPVESKPEIATIVESNPVITTDEIDQAEPDFEVPAALVEIQKSQTLNDLADLFDTGDSKVSQDGKRAKKVSQTPEFYRQATPQQIGLASRLIDNALRIIDAMPVSDQQKQNMAESYLLLDQDITNYENNPNYQRYKASIRTEVRLTGKTGVLPETETEVAAAISELEQRAKAEAERLERAKRVTPVTPPVTPAPTPEVREARREPPVEIQQQYAPKTDEEQQSFDRASTNKILARSPQLAVAAVRLKNGEITAGEYADLVDVLDPFVVKGAEPVPTNEKIYQYMSQTAGGKPTSEQGKEKLSKIGVFKKDGTQRIPNGKLAEFRIDIPTYNESTKNGDTVYSITGHEPVSETATQVGKTIAHLGIAKITNPQFITRTISGKGDAIQIAMGAGKFPLATVKGNYEAITELPADINDPNVWTETGYNPVRSSELVDVRSKKALVGGTEAIMVGSRVFVKNAQLEARPTGVTMGERYARRVQMGRAGMETNAVEARLQELGFPTGGIIRVVNQPDADFEGRTIILDGKVTGVELNSAALKDNGAIDRVLNHEFAESANADGALNRLVERLTPKEKKEINDTITRLRYEERARTSEEAARAIETLAEAWRGRGFFTRAVARVEAWASKLGFKLTRRAAEYIAARNLADINAGFRTAYNRFINVKGEAREGRVFVTPEENARFLELAKDPEANREELQKMVDDAAKKAGFSVFDWWHGTKKDFNTFKATRYDDGLIFFSSKRDFSERWAKNRKPDEKILERIESVKKEARKLVDSLFAADPRFDIKKPWSENTPEMNEAANKYLEAGKEFERSKLDGMTWIEAEREMGVRIIRAYLSADRIFDPSKDWREVLPEILNRLGVKSEAEIDKQSMDMLLKGNYLIWEDKKLTDAVFKKFDAMMIQEDSDGPMDTIAVRDPSLIKMADPVTYDDQGNVIPLEQRFQPTTADIRYARREVRESRREPEAIPTFTEGTPEAATLKEMATSMAKVDAASEAKGGKPETYKISEIASVWMDSGLGERELQDAIVEYTNLTPANAKRVASAIARQYDIQQSIATAFLETQTGLSVEALPEGVTLPKEVDPDRPKPVMQRLFEVFMGVKVPPKKITGSEKAFLRSQILLKIAANRAAKNAQKATADAVVETIKSMGLYGEVRPKQVAALAKRAAKVIWTSEKSVESFNDYAAKVVTNANYDADLREAKNAQKRAKQLSKQKNVAMSPQRQVLDNISRVAANRLDNPRMFADVVNYYMRAFKSAVSPDYVVMPDSELTSYLSQMESEETTNQAEIDRVANERLAAKYGVSVDEVTKLIEANNIIAELQNVEKREEMENLLTEKAIETQLGLSGYDTSLLRNDQKPLVEALLKVDPSKLDAKEKQKLIRIANNVIYNDQTNGAQVFVAIANGQQNARQAAQDSAMVKKNRAWIDILPTLGSKSAEKTFRNWALELQSVADTFRNIFGKESMAKMFRLMGLYDLDRGFTDSNNVLDKIQEAMAEFYKKNVKKYKAAARDQDGILSEGIVGFLIQRVPAKGESESIAQRRDLIKQDIANRRNSQESDRIAMADRIEKILNEIDGNTIEDILNNLKQKYRPNYDSLMYLMNDLLPQYKDFLQKFDENFNDQANNYDNPYYLPIDFINAGPTLEITPESEALFYENVSLRPKQAANTIKRVDYTKLPLDKSNKPKEIQFNLRKGTYDSLSEQINAAYTSEAWQKIFSFMKTPEAQIALGGGANRDFMVERLNRLRISRMRRGSMNNGAMAKFADSLSTISRKLGVGIALGGVYQVFKQSPDQLISAIGTTGRPDLLSESITTIGKAKSILNKFSIGRRGDASAGYKYINQMEGAQNRLERAFTESRWSEVKESASKIADVWMVALKKTDFACAAAAWMTYYRADLDKKGIKFEGWDREAQLVDTDPTRQDAASYAENMTDIYQGSSDPTKMATFAQSGKSGWENLFKAIFVPFNSFAVQQRMRIYSDARDAFTQSGEAGKAGAAGLTATVGGMLAFHTVRRLMLPVLTGAGATALYALLGVDMDEPDEEKQKEEANKLWRQFQGEVIANMLVGGAPQFVEAKLIDSINYANYMVSLQLESDDVIDDKGEIMSFDKYQKERSPLWRYRSFDNAMTLGMLDIGLGQAEKVAMQTKMLATPEEMEKYTPEEQRLLWFSALSEWMYLMRLNDADFARMVSKARKDMVGAVKDREKRLKAIRSGR